MYKEKIIQIAKLDINQLLMIQGLALMDHQYLKNKNSQTIFAKWSSKEKLADSKIKT